MWELELGGVTKKLISSKVALKSIRFPKTTKSLWGFLDLKSELIRKGETQNQGKNGQI